MATIIYQTLVLCGSHSFCLCVMRTRAQAFGTRCLHALADGSSLLLRQGGRVAHAVPDLARRGLHRRDGPHHHHVVDVVDLGADISYHRQLAIGGLDSVLVANRWQSELPPTLVDVADLDIDGDRDRDRDRIRDRVRDRVRARKIKR